MILIPPIPTLFQTADDVRRIVSTNDATTQGILIGVCLVLMAVIAVLYRENRSMQKEYVKTLKEVHAETVKMTNAYNEFVQIMYRNERGM